jgi:DNA-binding CsgD family transcriptional regulator
MAALLGDMAEASTYFARARTELEASGRRPLRAIVDYDEALALLRASSADHVHVSQLLDAALDQFRTLGMEAWLKRTLEQQEQIVLRHHPTSSAKQVYPDNLTAREVEVLRLLAEGKTNKEIAATLIVSVPTVQRHRHGAVSPANSQLKYMIATMLTGRYIAILSLVSPLKGYQVL